MALRKNSFKFKSSFTILSTYTNKFVVGFVPAGVLHGYSTPVSAKPATNQF